MSESFNTVEINTHEGAVRGAAIDGLAIFRGVPFAQAPIGSLRFMAPVPPAVRDGILDAVSPASICPQPPSRVFDALGEQGGEQSEDCLTATIWAPLSFDRPRPVLVWFHGGALSSGGGSVPWYDGATLARENGIVVVGLNYRLGALGFLCRPGLVDGNMGFLDQIRALEWLRENVSSFGGDPSQITVMGQSAGAMTIACLLAMPNARSLFRRAIFLSGGALTPSWQSMADAAAVAEIFCASLGIDPNASDALDRLQQVPTLQILEAQLATIRGSRRAAGDVMPTFMLAAVGGMPTGAEFEVAVRKGACEIDALIGTTAEEMRVFEGLDPRLKDLTYDDLPKVAEALLGKAWQQLIEQVGRARPGATPTRMLTDAYTERFVHGVRQVAMAVSDGSGKAWLFRFDWSAPDSGLGACHCIDLPFVFGNFDAFEKARMLAGGNKAAMSALSRAIRSAVGRFVRNGSPAGSDLPEWPSFSRSRPVLMSFDSLIDLAWLGDMAETG